MCSNYLVQEGPSITHRVPEGATTVWQAECTRRIGQYDRGVRTMLEDFSILHIEESDDAEIS